MSDNQTNIVLNIILKWTAVLFFMLMVVLVSIYCIGSLLEISWIEIKDEPLAVAIAYVTFSSSLALMLVLLLNYTLGPIEFNGLGFSFKGASGPVVLWVLCFLATIAGLSIIYESVQSV
jgi:hypothetical protein